jgi:hypothetical protein
MAQLRAGVAELDRAVGLGTFVVPVEVLVSHAWPDWLCAPLRPAITVSTDGGRRQRTRRVNHGGARAETGRRQGFARAPARWQ